jgi:hypothetical protein
MLAEEFLYLRAIGLNLALEGTQSANSSQGESTLGAGNLLSHGKLGSALEDFKPFGVGLRTVESMGVEELLPPAFTRFNEVLRGWELFHKGPGCWHCPIIKSLQGCRVILIKGLLELVDERGTFSDQSHLVATQQSQFANERVLRRKRPPAMAIHSSGACDALEAAGKR